MDSLQKENEVTEVPNHGNIDKISSISCSTAFQFELENKTNENEKLFQKAMKAKLTIEHLEKMISTSAFQLAQLTTEYAKTKKKLANQQQAADVQKAYQEKEIETLVTEFELSKSLLDGRIKRLERINQRNTALQNEVTNNRYKIFSLHFRSSAEDEESDHNKQNDISQTSTELSTVVTSDDGNTSKSTTSEELESTHDNYSS